MPPTAEYVHHEPPGEDLGSVYFHDPTDHPVCGDIVPSASLIPKSWMLLRIPYTADAFRVRIFTAIFSLSPNLSSRTRLTVTDKSLLAVMPLTAHPHVPNTIECIFGLLNGFYQRIQRYKI